MTAPLEKPDEELGRLFRDERAHEEVSLAQIERFAARLASTLALAAVPPAPTLPTAATPTAATSTAATSTAANAPSMLLGRAISLAVLCALGGTAVGFALGRWTAPAVLVPASPEPATDDASVEPDAGLEATPPTLEAAAPTVSACEWRRTMPTSF